MRERGCAPSLCRDSKLSLELDSLAVDYVDLALLSGSNLLTVDGVDCLAGCCSTSDCAADTGYLAVLYREGCVNVSGGVGSK